MNKASPLIETPRLRLRKPVAADAAAIFQRYSSDPEVTRYLGWPRHQSIAQTHTFLAWSAVEWNRWPAGPYLVDSRADGSLLGGTGLAFETPAVASTGYVLAREAWGHGYATEILTAMMALARELQLHRLYALCHADHRASARVLEKCGFILEQRMAASQEFPNLGTGRREDCLRYVLPAAGPTPLTL